jgi:uncharacterized protein HemX
MIRLALLGGFIAALVAGAAGYAFGHERGVESQAETIRGWIEQVADLDAKLVAQNDAVRRLDAAAKARRAEADRARARAEELVRDLAASEQRLLAAKPAYPEDPCRSACLLLRSPL